MNNYSQAPVFEFASHTHGRNAHVKVYENRIEWDQPRGISTGKLTAGVLTGGLSLLATGVHDRKAGTEMIPYSQVMSVTTTRDTLVNSRVSIITAGNTVDFRVSHKLAAEVKDLVTRLMLAV